MGVTDVPQWLLPAYVQAMSHAGATASREQLRDMGTNLITLWSTPDRAFHNLRHLIDLLTRVDELSEETRNPDLVRLAAWYHGAIFSVSADQAMHRNGGEDEAASISEVGRAWRRRFIISSATRLAFFSDTPASVSSS